MNRTDFPLKKTFEQEFITEEWDLLFILKYEQATIEEYEEMMFLPVEKQMQKIILFVRKQIKLEWWETIIRKFYPAYVSRLERSLDIWLMAKNVLINKFRTYKSIFDDLPPIFQKKWQARKWLYSANLSGICQKYNISVVELRKNITLEQYMWMIDWIIFSNNEMSEEWQKMNKYALIDKDEMKKRAEETKKLFSTRKIKK